MAGSSEKVHKVHRSANILSVKVEYNDTVLVKDTSTGNKLFFVRSKSEHKKRGPSQPVRRRVFLVSIPFQSYGGIFSGTPMMRRHRGQNGPWPLLHDDVHILRYWILCVVNDEGELPPSRAQLRNADFFECPQEPLIHAPSSSDRTRMFKLPRGTVESIEAIQELGRTSHSNNDIESERAQLNGLWGTYYAVLWNSQQFAIRLACLTLLQEFLPTAQLALRRLLAKLHNSTGDFLVARHLGCMGAFLGFGLATFGVGVFAAWGTAGGSMISQQVKENALRARIVVLRRTFPRLADI